MRFILTIILAWSLAMPLAIGQGRSEWRVSGDVAHKEGNVDILDGNVRAVKDGAVITCNRAESYAEQDIVKLLGNVVLTKEGTRLYATEIVINKKTDIADIRNIPGFVRVIDKNGTELRSPLMTYKIKDDIFKFFNGGVITSKDYIFESETGSYYEKEGKVFVKNKVQIHHKDYVAIADSANNVKDKGLTTVMGNIVFWHKDGILLADKGSYSEPSETFRLYNNSYALSKEHQAWADSIVYNKKKEQMFLGRNICILDTANHGALLADYGFLDKKKEYTFATKNACAVTFQPKEDSLFLRADTLMVYNIHNKKIASKDSLIRFAKALRNVRYFRTDLQGASDSLVYTTKDSVMYMYGVPLIWNEQNQISADSITVFTKNHKVDRAELVLNSFIAQKETDKYYNQIKGRSMTVHFDDKNKISRVDVKGNGQTVYFAKDSVSYDGVNFVTSSNIGINLSDGKISNIVYRVKPDAKISPLNQVDDVDLTLKGFKWTPENRPLSRFDITKKVVRQSRVKEVEAIAMPSFPIYQRIIGKKLSYQIQK